MPMPTAVRPRPMSAPAVMTAPQIARMSSLLFQRPPLLSQHAETATEHEEDARQDYENTAATTGRIGAVRSRRSIVAAAAKEPAATEWAATDAHGEVSLLGNRRIVPVYNIWRAHRAGGALRPS